MAPNKRRVFVVGVGMTKFEKPGRREWDYPEMVKEAVSKALADAGINFNQIQQAVVGYVYGDSTCGQRAVYEVGLTGIPIYNVNNNCSTGSTALLMAKQLIEGGVSDCVLALGFEKMERGSLTNKFNDRTNPLDKHINTMSNLRGIASAPFAPQMFGNAGREHNEHYGSTKEDLAWIAWKNHKHSTLNPYSQFQEEYSISQILSSPTVYEPLTKLQCCPTSDGAAAAIIVNEDFVSKFKLHHKAVEILAMAMATDTQTSFQNSCIKMVGSDMTKAAASKVYQQTGLSANDVQVIELHDCFSANELITYEALQLAPEGKAHELVKKADVTFGGKWVVNPSGGLISKGHPLGATGLAQCAELCWQLRGMCGKRQVPNARIALQHNIGLRGAVVVALYKLGFPEAVTPLPQGSPNPAIDAKAIFPSPASATEASNPTEFKSDSIFEEVKARIAGNSGLLKTVSAIYQFNVTSDTKTSKSWTVDVKNPPGSVRLSKPDDKPDCTLNVSDTNLVALLTGKQSGQQLFSQGKLKIAGNLGLALKLDQLVKTKAAI